MKKTAIIPVVALWISLASFVFNFVNTAFPYKFPWRNKDYEKRALAGEIASQMLIADLNYRISNVDKSISFYTLVTLSANYNNDDDRFNAMIASNNLGYIFATEKGGAGSSAGYGSDVADEPMDDASADADDRDAVMDQLKFDARDADTSYGYARAYYLYALKALHPFLNTDEMIEGLSRVITMNYINSYLSEIQGKRRPYNKAGIVSELSKAFIPSDASILAHSASTGADPGNSEGISSLNSYSGKGEYIDPAFIDPAYAEAFIKAFLDVYLPYTYSDNNYATKEELRYLFEGYFRYNTISYPLPDNYADTDYPEFTPPAMDEVLDAYPELADNDTVVIGLYADPRYINAGRVVYHIYTRDIKNFVPDEAMYIDYGAYAKQLLNRFFDDSYYN